MGLAVSVGALADFLQFDDEAAAWIRSELATIEESLLARGYPTFVEPTQLPQLDNRCALKSYPYSWVHYLRRAYTHTKLGIALAPVPEGQSAADDAAVLDESVMMESHLLCHSDAEGFYVPVDFDEIVFDDRIAGSMVGSSYRLREELVSVAPALGITLVGGELCTDEAERLNALPPGCPWEQEIWTWFSHWEAARLSIAHSTMVFYM